MLSAGIHNSFRYVYIRLRSFALHISYLYLLYLFILLEDYCRSQWPRCLRHELYSPARTLGSWVPIPLEAWMFLYIYSVFVLSCVGSGLATA
jgi:hypothetical protein